MGNLFAVRYSEGRPAWMREGSMRATLLEGFEDLEVIGESHFQHNLWRILGGRHKVEVHVRMDIYAMLLAEEGNPYDANAVWVWIDGMQVGHLQRDDARSLRPGLIALQGQHGTPIALQGVIVGGGVRQDGPGRLGVFLNYDHEDFGQPDASYTFDDAPYVDARLRRALGDEVARSKDCPYSLTWMHGLETDDMHAIRELRKALTVEIDPIGRHFTYAELEAALYRCRDVFASALDEYDQACRRHDAEMDSIRPACMAVWGKVPLAELYKQMAIRQQKAHDFAQALWWAERGLAVYGEDAARPEAVEDLRKRAAGYRAKLVT
ncbi:MAG TPA: hypothetical protein VMA72_26210 [Streptosporangiaceae bacterium]|nr:hypothetical protein [Streptosporangiaceae bacterium]